MTINPQTLAITGEYESPSPLYFSPDWKFPNLETPRFQCPGFVLGNQQCECRKNKGMMTMADHDTGILDMLDATGTETVGCLCCITCKNDAETYRRIQSLYRHVAPLRLRYDPITNPWRIIAIRERATRSGASSWWRILVLHSQYKTDWLAAVGNQNENHDRDSFAAFCLDISVSIAYAMGYQFDHHTGLIRFPRKGCLFQHDLEAKFGLVAGADYGIQVIA